MKNSIKDCLFLGEILIKFRGWFLGMNDIMIKKKKKVWYTLPKFMLLAYENENKGKKKCCYLIQNVPISSLFIGIEDVAVCSLRPNSQ